MQKSYTMQSAPPADMNTPGSPAQIKAVVRRIVFRLQLAHSSNRYIS